MVRYLDIVLEHLVDHSPSRYHGLRSAVRAAMGSHDLDRHLRRAIRRGLDQGVIHKRGSDFLHGPDPEGLSLVNNARVDMGAYREERIPLRAKIARRGKVQRGQSRGKPTVLLTHLETDMTDPPTPIADHVWVFEGKAFSGIDLAQWVKFEARVTTYVKKGGERDFRLFYPRNITMIKERDSSSTVEAKSEPHEEAEVALSHYDSMDDHIDHLRGTSDGDESIVVDLTDSDWSADSDVIVLDSD